MQHQLPILQIVLPLLSAPLCVVLRERRRRRAHRACDGGDAGGLARLHGGQPRRRISLGEARRAEEEALEAEREAAAIESAAEAEVNADVAADESKEAANG